MRHGLQAPAWCVCDENPDEDEDPHEDEDKDPGEVEDTGEAFGSQVKTRIRTTR